jgi:hypothetical protein
MQRRGKSRVAEKRFDGCVTNAFDGFTMRTPILLSLVNAVSAATLLIVLSVSTNTGKLQIKSADVIEATKDTSPEIGLDLLARGIKEWQQRATLLKWLCCGSLLLLVVNAGCWATWRSRP